MAFDIGAAAQLAAKTVQSAGNAVGEYADLVSFALAHAFTDYPVLVLAIGLAATVPLLAVVGLLVPRKRHRVQGLSMTSAGAASQSGDSTTEGERVQMTSAVLRFGAVTADPQAGPIRIGSDPGSHLRCDGPGIEPLHALITYDAAQGLQLVRLAASRGVSVYVDGKIVSRCSLSGSETIRIGHNFFVFDTHDGMSPKSNQSVIEAATNPILSAVAAARREIGANSTRATWRAEETAGATNAQVDHSSVH